MNLPAGCTLNYVVGHEVAFWTYDDRRHRYIRVGADTADRGCVWEFMIEEHVFTGSDTAMRVCLFDDAWQAFTQIPELFTALRVERPRTLDAIRTLLDRIGAHDITRRHHVAECEHHWESAADLPVLTVDPPIHQERCSRCGQVRRAAG